MFLILSVNEEIGRLMKSNPSLGFLTILIGIIITLFFHFFLFKPFNKWLDKRSKYLDKINKNILKEQKQIEIYKKEKEQELLNSKFKIRKLKEESSNNIKNIYKKEMFEINKLKNEIFLKTKIDVKKFKKNSKIEIKEIIIDNSIFLTKKILKKKNINKEKNKKIIDKFLNKFN